MNIEAKYLNIRWKNKNEIEEVKENFLSEKLEYINDNVYFLQLYTYTKIDNLYAQIAFQLDDDNIIPVILLNNGRKKELKKIIDPVTNKIWWVENNKWNKKGKYYESLFINHIGDTKIYFGDIRLDINVKLISLTEDDLEIIFDEFKNELWKIIYDQKSYSNITIKSNTMGITEQYKKLLEEYISSVDSILKSPKVELTDYFVKENIKKIKPTTKTFIEYISDPSKQYYSSKSKLENHNIPENQYIYWTLNCVKYLLKNNIRYQKYIKGSTSKKIDEYKNKINEINEVLQNNKINVNENLFYQNIENLFNERDELVANILSDTNQENKRQQRLFRININYISHYNDTICFESKIDSGKIIYRLFSRQFEKVLKDYHKGEYEIVTSPIKFLEKEKTFIEFKVPPGEIKPLKKDNYDTLLILNEYNQSIRDYFFKIKLLSKKKETESYVKYECMLDINYTKEFYKIKDKLKNIYCSISFPIQFEIEKKVDINNYFLINADISYKFPYLIENIISIKPIKYDEMITKLQEQAKRYEENNWQRKLNANDRSDRELINYLKQETKVLNNIYVKMKENYGKLLNEEELIKLNTKILTQDILFQTYKIRQSSIFPNTMTYVQNYSYSNAYKNFKKLLDIQNIDIKQLELIQYFERNISINNMPKVYERWCFLIVLNILMGYFNFQPMQSDWINVLLQQILQDNPRDVKIELNNKDLECHITVWYEKEFLSQKRPDIVLEITYLNLKPYKIVFDAKFHEEADIKELIYELYYDKDYAERKSYKKLNDVEDDILNYNSEDIEYSNKVFILHPDLKAMARNNIIINNQKWGEVSYYGEGILFDTEEYREKIKKQGDIVVANHRYGAIAIHPKNFSYQTMMQRLIGMCLQYYPYNLSQKIPDKWICIACGQVNDESSEIKSQYEDNINDYDIYFDTVIHTNFKHKTCRYCGNIAIFTHCFSCKVKLIKNGVFWTYHNNNEDSIYNIKCPNCNSFFTKEQSDKYYEMKQNKSTNYSRKF